MKLFAQGRRLRAAGRRDGEAGGLGSTSPRLPVALSRRRPRGEGGWTLIELMVVVTVLSILTMGVIPLARTAVKRQKEARLREALREMREAIKEFHRDTVGAPCCTAAGAAVPGGVGGPTPPPQPGVPGLPGVPGQQSFLDPRSKVAISDRTIFNAENMDHYPPTLEVLVEGVNVVPRAGMQGGAPDINRPPTEGGPGLQLSLKKKMYLRRIPVDPMTGKPEWGIRSCYQEQDDTSWDQINVFDVYSLSEDEALNGEKYSEW